VAAAGLTLVTFVNAGTLGTISGHRHELVATLTRRNELLRELGCSLYEVGISADAPDTVFVVEVWDSEEAHRRSLDHSDVQASIAAARPLLSGEHGGFRFDVVGSPLRDA
jgi:quinol monooxygenase YgiN